MGTDHKRFVGCLKSIGIGAATEIKTDTLVVTLFGHLKEDEPFGKTLHVTFDKNGKFLKITT